MRAVAKTQRNSVFKRWLTGLVTKFHSNNLEVGGVFLWPPHVYCVMGAHAYTIKIVSKYFSDTPQLLW